MYMCISLSTYIYIYVERERERERTRRPHQLRGLLQALPLVLQRLEGVLTLLLLVIVIIVVVVALVTSNSNSNSTSNTTSNSSNSSSSSSSSSSSDNNLHMSEGRHDPRLRGEVEHRQDGGRGAGLRGEIILCDIYIYREREID